MSFLSSCLGFPRIGASRELKKALESFWAKQTSAEQLAATARELRQRHWQLMKSAGIDIVPSNDFSLYDHMLDMTVTLGAIPKRYHSISSPLARYFAMARGLQDQQTGIDLAAMEMTKWFDTNYHYIVPELDETTTFTLDASHILAGIAEARQLGLEARPVIPGPITFLRLAKSHDGKSTLDFLPQLLPVYRELLSRLAEEKVAWVQLDEPCLVLDLDKATIDAYRQAFSSLISGAPRPKLLLTTYFGSIGDNLPLALALGCEGIHLDLVRAPEQLAAILPHLAHTSVQLSLGLIDGRNIWRSDLDQAHTLVRQALQQVDSERLSIAPSCSLMHVPVDLQTEQKLEEELKNWLAFATQKLHEVKALALSAAVAAPTHPLFTSTRAALEQRSRSPRTYDTAVRQRLRDITPAMLQREPFAKRVKAQQQRFKLPLLPTTTIGSFPQTKDIRSARSAWRQGKLSHEAYQKFLKEEIKHCIDRQETIGLDVLVHGEFERNDMVEYFGEQLLGFAFTENGWVQSYGSRYVKPPILFGDVSRVQAMTVTWSRYAQSLTQRPVKGMLTGPVTILQWSFIRNDQPRQDTCWQLALALRDEVSDLEQAGIPMIQVDEPAIREGLPLRRRDWDAYLRWAVDAFRLATSGIRSETQIHTHMCYAEFGDILDAIAAMDADVLSIETSRSHMELLSDFGHFHYPNEVGPGVYDIHSPRVPTQGEMETLLRQAVKVLPPNHLWVNPDCGLKTRAWPEVDAALSSMVAAARHVRVDLEHPGHGR